MTRVITTHYPKQNAIMPRPITVNRRTYWLPLPRAMGGVICGLCQLRWRRSGAEIPANNLDVDVRQFTKAVLIFSAPMASGAAGPIAPSQASPDPLLFKIGCTPGYAPGRTLGWLGRSNKPASPSAR